VPQDARPAGSSGPIAETSHRTASTSRSARSSPKGRHRFRVPANVRRGTVWTGAGNRLQLLGEFRLTVAGGDVLLPHASQRLVAYVALAAGRSVSRRCAIATLWPDSPQAQARSALRSTLWRIRRLAPGLITGDGERLLLAPLPVDADALRDAIRAALSSPGQSGPATLATLTDAAELLVGWDDDWVEVERARMREIRLEALELLAADLTRRGLVGQAIEAGLAAVADEPFRESAHRVLIEAYVRKGNAAAAIDRYRRFRRALRRELGVLPSEELADRIRRLVQATGSGGAPRSTATPKPKPTSRRTARRIDPAR
jgi:DNA-binding SARP family transcriptional activator